MPLPIHRRRFLLATAASGGVAGVPVTRTFGGEQSGGVDPAFHVCLAFGQSNMKAFPASSRRTRPLLAGEAGNAEQNGAAASVNEIIAQLRKLVPTAHVVSPRSCESRPDRLHFTPAGYRDLGRRYLREC